MELLHLRPRRAPDHRTGRGRARGSARRSRLKGPSVMKRDLQHEMKALGQTVLVLQGGGALGAYQVGVYEALAEAGVEPDWVIGTSTGAINAALIAGNRPADR